MLPISSKNKEHFDDASKHKASRPPQKNEWEIIVFQTLPGKCCLLKASFKVNPLKDGGAYDHIDKSNILYFLCFIFSLYMSENHFIIFLEMKSHVYFMS